ncbi:MAG: proteasome subunit alpha, partial [Candidatus Micrarchaeota archaeon]|nr:proteasome subunit alpha [Candidatus Micrarchaeota archaeon]
GKKAVEEILEKEYRDDLTLEEGVKLGFKALKKVAEDKLSAGMVDLTLVKADDHRVHKVSKDQKAQWL